MKGSESLCVVLHISPYRTVLDQLVVRVQGAPYVLFAFQIPKPRPTTCLESGVDSGLQFRIAYTNTYVYGTGIFLLLWLALLYIDQSRWLSRAHNVSLHYCHIFTLFCYLILHNICLTLSPSFPFLVLCLSCARRPSSFFPYRFHGGLHI